MVEYGRVKAANFTNFVRYVIVRANMGLADGMLLPDSTRDVTVIDPLNDGVNRRCQWSSSGPLYASGYCRNIIVSFIAKLNAGVAAGTRGDGILHSFLGGSFSSPNVEREFVIDDSTPTNEVFAIHPEVLPRMFNTRIIMTIPLKDANGNTYTQACSMTLVEGYFGQGYVHGNSPEPFLLPETIVKTAGYFEEDPNINRDILYQSIASRIYPEKQGGTRQNLSSFWQKAFMAIPKNQRFIDIWWSCGNSFVTRDSGVSGTTWPPSAPRFEGTNQILNGDIQVKIIGPRVGGMWKTSGIKNFAEVYDAVQDSWTTTFNVTDVDTSVANHITSRYNDGASTPVIRFTLFFENGSMSGDDTTTRDALVNFSDSSSWVTPICSTWPNVEASYGPYGSIPARPGNGNIPANSLISSDATARVGCANLAYDDWNYYQDGVMLKNQKYGFDPYGGATAGYPCFFVKGWPFARSGFPDLRGRIRDTYFDCWRPTKFYEEDVNPIEIENYYQRANINNSPRALSDIVFFGSRPHFINGNAIQPNSIYQCKLGKNTGRGANLVSKRNAAAPYVDNVTPRDLEHDHSDDVPFTLLLSADIGIQYFIIPHWINACLCNKPHRDGAYAATLSRQNSTVYGYTNSAMTYGVPRSEARWVGMTSSLYWVTGDIRLIKKFLLRKETIYLLEIPVGNQANLYATPGSKAVGMHLNKELVTHALGSDFNGTYFQAGTVYNPWQALLLPQFLLGIHRALTLSDVSALDLSEINDPNNYKDLAEHAREIKQDILWPICRAFVLHGIVKTSATDNKYVPFEAIDYFWDPNQIGKALPTNIKNQAVARGRPSSINPATNRPYFKLGTDWHYKWTINAVIIAYELASEYSDLTVLDEAKKMLTAADGGYSLTNQAVLNSRGWGSGTNENDVEVAAVIPNPFKTRDSTVIYFEVDFDGSSSMNVQLINNDLVTVNLDGIGFLLINEAGIFPIETDQFITPLFDGVGTLSISALTVGVAQIIVANFSGELSLSANLSNTAPILPYVEDIVFSGQSFFTRMYLYVNDNLPEGTKVFNLYGLIQFVRRYSVSKVGYKTPSQNLEFGNNETIVLNITIDTSQSSEDISLYVFSSIEWLIYENSTNPAILLQKNLSDGITIINDTNLILRIDSGELEDYLGRFKHVLYGISSDGSRYTILNGSVTLEESIPL
jgi:hypothetical protein